MGLVMRILSLKLPMKKIFTLCLLFCSQYVHGQENYEIQVYASPTMAKGSTMVELHSNYTLDGTKSVEDGVLPTNHMLHETVEITHGFTQWFETGVYFFNALGSDNRTTYVGSHLRPRVMVPEKWHWPVGVSLSFEFGYQKLEYSPDDWSLEIRPIIDKTWGKYYLCFNPTFEKALRGATVIDGFQFTPNVKTSYGLFKFMAVGIEYYGGLGNPRHFFSSLHDEHLVFVAADFTFTPEWELNAGYGLGFPSYTDNDIFKVILGYRFHKKKSLSAPSIGILPVQK
jgi:hypothetical protein